MTGKGSTCKLCNRKQQLCLCDRKRGVDRKPGLFCDRQERRCKNFDCKFLSCCRLRSFYKRVSTKERCKSQLLLSVSRNKACERCFLCRTVEFCKKCHKCPNCCTKSTCRGQITPVLEKWASLDISPKVLTVLREFYILPFQFCPNLTRSPTITSCYVNTHTNHYMWRHCISCKTSMQ